MKTLKKFNEICEDILNEMPQNIKDAPSLKIRNIVNNKKNYDDAINIGKLLGKFNFKDETLYLYEVKRYNYKHFIAINKETPQTIGSFEINDLGENNLELSNFWVHDNYHGIGRILWNDFILKLDFNSIQEDGEQTPAGKKFFLTQILEPALKQPEKFKCFIRNDNKEIILTTLQEFEKMYGSDPINKNNRIVIQKLT